MKVTRFVNGEKIDKNIDSRFLITQTIIADTIETVNNRLKVNNGTQNLLKGQRNE